MKEITLEADIKNLIKVTSFVNEELRKVEANAKTIASIDIILDEVFSNIAYYAYKEREEKGDVTVKMDFVEDNKAVVLSFIDDGIPYNPLEKEEPDITLSAMKRAIGGLGILIVKKSVDDIKYEYKNNKNILKLKKYL